MSPISDKLKSQKLAIYVRVSTHWQVDKDSLQVQRRELIAYSEMVLGISDYVIFEDPGYSAKNTDRPDYQRMMDRLRTGEFTHLLVWKIDRISRNLLDFASMHQELKDLGIAFVSKNEQFDTSTAIGEAMLKIILIFAELERNMTSERVTAVMLSRASNGQWNGGRIPYGYAYDKVEKKFSLDEQENKVYNTICNLYEQYQSVLYIVRYLNDSGIRTRGGKEWTCTTVHKILTNVFYTGSYLYNVHSGGKGATKRNEGEWITMPNHHEPSIGQDRFQRIQFILKRNKRGGVSEGQTYVKKNLHVFAGLVRCGMCGANMSATLDRRRANGWRPSLYACSKHRNNTSLCENKYVSDVTLGPFVINYIANIIRAKNTMGGRTTIDVLERKLLRGEAFADVDHIEREGLAEMQDLLVSGITGMEYRPHIIFDSDSPTVNERELLDARRRKKETALSRLKALYLYGDEETPEKDFIIERQKIVDELNSIDARLVELQAGEQSNTEASNEFIEKAAYFLMVEQLLNGRTVDYEKYIRKIDPSVPRNFLNNLVRQIDVSNGRIVSISFKNGMKHSFIYKS